MGPVPRHANVFLSFGSVEVNFAAQRIANARGNYNLDRLLKNTVDKIVHGRKTLLQLGFNHVYAVFVAPVVDLPDSYWKGLSIDNQIPSAIRARMSYDLALKVERKIPAFNLLPEMVISPDIPFAKPELVRSKLDHHVDYIASQDIVWQAINKINGMLPRRKPRHDVIYPHVANGIQELRESGLTRPKTCN